MNKVILIGRLTRDPEMRTTSSGIANTRFSLAVNRQYQDQNGERGVDYLNCVVWRKQAENVAKYCTKGSQVAVEGRIQTGSYDAQDGTKRYTTDIVCDNVTFLGSKNSESGNNNEYNNYNNYNSNNGYNNYSNQEMNENVPTSDISEDPFKDFGDEIALSDDDLPF
jgi:single-strand DNA-binding protein